MCKINDKFNLWTIIDISEKKNNRKAWLCKCECGTIRSVEERRLKNGTSKSCGCLAIKNMNKAIKRNYDRNTKEYHFWGRYKKTTEFADYENFLKWLETMNYNSELHYLSCKSNILTSDTCNIVSKKDMKNGRSKYYELNGEKLNLSQISSKYNINERTLSSRLKSVPIEIAILSSNEFREYKKLQKRESKKQTEYIPLAKIDFIAEYEKSGVYAIKNLNNGKMYIGSSKDIGARWKHHINSLNKGTHHSRYLQNSWNKYGGGSFSFSVLEYCNEESRLEREQYYLDFKKPQYNMSEKAHAPIGVKVSDETRMKMSNNSTWKKAILQIDKNTMEVIKEWESANLAGKTLSIDSSSIRKVCRGEMKSYKGFIWQTK